MYFETYNDCRTNFRIKSMKEISESNSVDKCAISAVVELNIEDEQGRTICFDFPIGLDVFIAALIFAEIQKQQEPG